MRDRTTTIKQKGELFLVNSNFKRARDIVAGDLGITKEQSTEAISEYILSDYDRFRSRASEYIEKQKNICKRKVKRGGEVKNVLKFRF